MNLGDFKREWARIMGRGQSVQKVDLYLAELRAAELVEATGRGQAASDISFDDALNLAIVLILGREAKEGPALIHAVREASLSRNKTRVPISSKQQIRELGAKDESFASVMRALAEKTPLGVRPRRQASDGGYLVSRWRQNSDLHNVSDFLNHYPLQIDFHKGQAIVELSMRRIGPALKGVDLPDDLYLRWSNGKPGLTAIGREEIHRCNWWLPYVLRLVIDWRADKPPEA